MSGESPSHRLRRCQPSRPKSRRFAEVGLETRLRAQPLARGPLERERSGLRRKASFRKEVPQFANWGGGLYFAAGEMYEIIKVCKTLFTAYVLLRKTQSSVSLRLTAPFKRGLWSGNETVCVEKPPLAKGGRAAGRSPVAGGFCILPVLFYPDTVLSPSGIGKGRTLALRAVVSKATVVVRRWEGGCGGRRARGSGKMTVFTVFIN